MSQQQEKVVDGSNIRSLVEDKEAFRKYVNQKFEQLHDGDGGRLRADELQPIVEEMGAAMGLPPRGSSPDADLIYHQILDEFVREETPGEGIGKQEFGRVLGDMLLGVADGLQREPIAICQLDGSQLEKYVHGPHSDMDAVAAFSQTSGSAGRTKGDVIFRALSALSVEQGMPPASDRTVACMIEAALKRIEIDLTREFTQSQLVDAYKRMLLEIASQLRNKPINVAHVEKTFDGSSISQLLQDKPTLTKALEEAWSSLPKDRANKIPKSCIRLGLDSIGPYAGIPPQGAMQEMDKVLDDSMKLENVDQAKELIDKEEFMKCILEILGGIMLQLQGEPISISSSRVAEDETKDTYL